MHKTHMASFISGSGLGGVGRSGWQVLIHTITYLGDGLGVGYGDGREGNGDSLYEDVCEWGMELVWRCV